ncbi:PH domain-containing protein [Yinghuangia seranimata]|uniref:PH domain-containing protein n=1 Tax=Yinghuangia seranimata TaxID=408067 RepID=UPI00248CA622|nr:PH domain-containing protein [Yinghuangia seranimata]MDI2130987.1 PH domain-containing protein [Yinghuangia seranimata]
MAALGGPPEAELILRQHWRVLVRPVGVLFVVVGAAAFLAAVAPRGGGRDWARIAVGVLAVAAIARWSVVPWLRWLTNRQMVVEGRLVVRTGVLRQEGRAVPLTRVADVTFAQDTLVERVLGSGTLVVVLEDGREPVELPGLPRVAELQARLLRMVDLARDEAWHAGRLTDRGAAAAPFTAGPEGGEHDGAPPGAPVRDPAG